MAKHQTKTIYVCDNCGQEYLQWQGKCDACNEWNTLKQLSGLGWSNNDFLADTNTQTGGRASQETSLNSGKKLKAISQLQLKAEIRIKTNLGELDRVLGGGIVPGSLVLLSGDPGVGKSTLLLQMSAQLANQEHKVLYVSGEESEAQISSRAARINAQSDQLLVTSIINVMALVSLVQQAKVDVMVIDSVQTLIHPDFPSSPGSMVQLRECALILQRLAKRFQIAIFLVGHITKQGTIAGPKVLEHIVDTVLSFDAKSDRAYRLLRVDKNRFGDTAEVGVMAMSQTGFESVTDPSSYFLSERNIAPGSSLTVIMEGNRPMILEIQALVNKTVFGYPKRTAAGFDVNRLQLLLAILERHLKLPLSEYDVYVNVVGGLKVREPAADLAVCAAIVSSLKSRAVPAKLCLFGEVGLTGEIRKVLTQEGRLQTLQRLGYETLPFTNSLADLLGGLFN